MDREYDFMKEADTNEKVRTAYLKVVNVPSAFDCGNVEASPEREHLQLSYIDVEAQAKVQEELSRRVREMQLSETGRFDNALKAVHVNL